MNGAVEAANKNIKRIISKTTDTFKGWHKKLPFAMFAYRTSIRTSTGATPYSLVYGMEAVLPIEIEIPSLRILNEVQLDEAEWVQAREFKVGDIVLKRISPNIRDDHGKWMRNWEGPYVLKKTFSGGALILTEMDKEELKNPINADAVKKYYA
ncbi:hypothetical protein V6N13_082083 [Hibiscus sabdariffa]